MNWTVLKAIFRRDFVSYFSNPTGYVFICVFVMLSALAAFWPPDFFSNNLANLDQLNKWLPFILLVFIPAITMSIWAEERRQHTDELLLTLPASDIDVVLGKYLASVAIYTVALLFSMFSIYLVFSYGLGTPDAGLFVGTYVGYWFIGLAMLAIGMVASFLTSNLTVGFILGMIFNLPLAMFGVADWIIKNPQLAQAIKRWSAPEQFRDFERGVISLSGISYFVMIAVVMLYISMVLIGRRHWGGREEDEVDVGPLPGPRAGPGGAGDRRESVPLASQLAAGRHHQREAQLALAADGRAGQRAARQQGRQVDQDRRLRQPAGAGRVRGAQAQLALDAHRTELAERRQDPGRRARDRELQRRSEQRREGVRHRAARGA